ncbi:4Fe-4S dicluster domain-containing protein [Desulfospira joergensenii]|uniref:4Fe-4S dicluster domain-containing protein n=1 Tax=Desulfospira joergensenii TaxID=53329 RepID=UPI0003B7AE57|nr:4Fe-4S dicluster domain-containing protein [Desulfospira joergensenii]
MEKIRITKGFKNKIPGRPDLSVITRQDSDTLALTAVDIPHIRPKLLVKEGEEVKTGTPLFHDKRDRSIQYVSPGTGRVEKILFGERRRLLEVVIRRDREDEFVEFEPVGQAELKDLSKEALVDRLKQGGVWQGMRQLPFRDTADASQDPPMIIVCLEGNDIFSPHPGLVLGQNVRDFLFGLELLALFSGRILVGARAGRMDIPEPVKNRITHVLPDVYPAWDPAVILFQIKTEPAHNSAWYIRADHLVMMARFLSSGKYPVDKMVTVTHSRDSRPHILTRQGAPVRLIAGTAGEKSLMTTGRFNGRVMSMDHHLGFFDDTINIIDANEQEEMFGFIRPGLNKPTVSRTFLSSLVNWPRDMDCTLHGEERACISCSYCEKICPSDLMPNFIVKALLADDIEEALSLGLLDCCRCGLCSYACPSKIELADILSRGMDAYYKDKS